MHRCLHIHEVLELIVTYLYNEGRCPRSLASMAVACRAFYEPATNQLWSRLRGMKPLIQCLPPDAIEIHDKDSNYPHAIVSMHIAFAAAVVSLRDGRSAGHHA